MARAEKQSPEEELRSYNEELQSANEELQSLNEELETSKEELQSLNEELATVNAELQGKNEELSSANDDIRNLLDSTKIATLFLDTRLCVKRFTPEVAQSHQLGPGRRWQTRGPLQIQFGRTKIWLNNRKKSWTPSCRRKMKSAAPMASGT